MQIKSLDVRIGKWRRLKQSEIQTLEEAFNTGQGAGYVLDFSDRTFAAYFDEEFGIDIDHEPYRINGSSKGKRLPNISCY
jgi:hypothetical protein